MKNFKSNPAINFSVRTSDNHVGAIFQNPFCATEMTAELLAECTLQLKKISGVELDILLEIMDVNVTKLNQDEDGNVYLPTLVAYHDTHKVLGNYVPNVVVGGAKLHYTSHALKDQEKSTLKAYRDAFVSLWSQGVTFTRNADVQKKS